MVVVKHSVDELDKLIDEYFNQIEATGEEPCEETLARFIGLSSVNELMELREHKRHSYQIKRALMRIEIFHEIRLSFNDPEYHVEALIKRGWKA